MARTPADEANEGDDGPLTAVGRNTLNNKGRHSTHLLNIHGRTVGCSKRLNMDNYGMLSVDDWDQYHDPCKLCFAHYTVNRGWPGSAKADPPPRDDGFTRPARGQSSESEPSSNDEASDVPDALVDSDADVQIDDP